MNFPETSSFINIFNLLQFRDLKKEKKSITLEARTGRFRCESQLWLELKWVGFLIGIGIGIWYWVGNREWWAEKGERVGQTVGKSQLERVEVGGLRHFASF